MTKSSFCVSPIISCKAVISGLLILLSLFALGHARAASVAIVPESGTAFGDAIQSALDEVSGGGEVVLAPGTYVIRKPIILAHDGQRLSGSGPGTILFLEANADCPVVIGTTLALSSVSSFDCA